VIAPVVYAASFGAGFVVGFGVALYLGAFSIAMRDFTKRPRRISDADLEEMVEGLKGKR